jgi:hypothetical protein
LQVKIDLHVHSHFSSDSVITPKQLGFYAKRHGLDGVAITDHDRLDSALAIAKSTDLLIVPGIEVSSLNGHIIGLNVQEKIPKKLGSEETVDRIHDAGGIAIACHPLAFFKGSLGKHTNAKFDAVEVVNASAFPFNRSVVFAQRLAWNLRIAQVGGSDAHYGPEIGYGYTLIDAELEIDEIIRAIIRKRSQPRGKPIPLTIRLKREFMTLVKKIRL